MNRASFEQLCRDTCAALDHADPASFISTNQIRIDDINIGLFFDEFDMNDRLVCYVDIGELPDIEREEILERMLAMNLLTGTKVSGVYGLDLQRDCIVFVQHFLYPDLLDGAELAEILQSYAQHAKGVQLTLMNETRAPSISDPAASALPTSAIALA